MPCYSSTANLAKAGHEPRLSATMGVFDRDIGVMVRGLDGELICFILSNNGHLSFASQPRHSCQCHARSSERSRAGLLGTWRAWSELLSRPEAPLGRVVPPKGWPAPRGVVGPLGEAAVAVDRARQAALPNADAVLVLVPPVLPPQVVSATDTGVTDTRVSLSLLRHLMHLSLLWTTVLLTAS